MDQNIPQKKVKQSIVQKLKATYKRKRSKFSKHDVKHAEAVEIESQKKGMQNESCGTSLTKVSIPKADEVIPEATVVKTNAQRFREVLQYPEVVKARPETHLLDKHNLKEGLDGAVELGRIPPKKKQSQDPRGQTNRRIAEKSASQIPVDAPRKRRVVRPPTPEPPSLFCSSCGAFELWDSDEFPLHLAALGFLCVICRSPFLSLPIELFQEVQSYLDTNSLWMLRLSCKRLWNAIPAPSNPKEGKDVAEFFRRIRCFVPRRLEYCEECVKYHIWLRHVYFWWDDKQRCRRAAGADNQPSFYGGCLGADYYVCKHCNTRQRYSHCTLCFKCEACVGKRFHSRLIQEGGRVTIKGTPIYCRSCISLKIECCRCDQPTLARRACHKCGKCEKCSNTLYQFGETRCWECGGKGLSSSSNTRRVAVERGQGYEMYYYGGQPRSAQNQKKIGMR